MTDETNENTPAITEETNDTYAPARWTKGMPSPNPAGRPKMPKTVKEVKELAKEFTPMALKTLAAVCGNPKARATGALQRQRLALLEVRHRRARRVLSRLSN
jgi:hypothetical protein